MMPNHEPVVRLKRAQKKVQFKRDSILEEVRVFSNQEYQQPPPPPPPPPSPPPQQSIQNEDPISRNKPKGKGKALNISDIPPLFRCKSGAEVHDILRAGRGSIADIFQGYNALHWYSNAKSTSPSVIHALLRAGIDIDAVDRRSHVHGRGPVIRHTALGYACRNANVKAVHVLLQHGASPSGLAARAEQTPSSSPLPRRDKDGGGPIVYPSPLQELLCQPIHGPRPGRCPWTYHLSEDDEEQDGYLDEDDESTLPEFRALPGLTGVPADDRPVCQECVADYHILEPWPTTEAEKVAARERRRSRYYAQIQRLGSRIQRCVQLLLDHSCSDPPILLRDDDDPHLWSGMDYFLETSWRFLGPLAVCWREEGVVDKEVQTPLGRLLHIPSQAVFSPFGEVCDMLLESAGYEGKRAGNGARGQERLVSLIATHPDFGSFKQGEFFDVDAQLE
ncbi:hypothetical protein F5Y19DRAFT_482674 [Xylariaceae sp. FL1651]|nr:hypothetical protein F5Y19DRAFT_482674 [Xylariaceae sp. FL1651]